jgi:hypothetical protein
MSERIVPQDFYVYVHRKATTGSIFYCGKGQGKRAWDKTERNRHWKIVAKKHGVIVEIVQDGLQEWAAFELETDLIALYGRKDLGLGDLVNYADGGQGSSGVIQSAETRLKKSLAHTGKKKSEEEKRRISETNKKTKSCPLVKKAASERMSGEKHPLWGKKASAETRLKMSEAKAKKPVSIIETGQVFASAIAAALWISAKQGKDACPNGIRGCCKGKRKTAYGYQWAYAD